MKTKCIYAGRLLVATAVLLLGVMGYVYYEKTLIDWWEPVVASGVIALVTLPLLYRRWGWLTGVKSPALNILCHLYMTGLLSYFLFLGGNYLLADASSTCEEEVMIVSKEKETKERRFRVRRHSYRSKTVHYYYLNVRFKDGTCKRIPVSLSVYNRSKANSYRTFDVQRGGWGFRIIP